MDSLSTFKKNKVYAPMIAGVAIIVAILLASPMYSAYSEADAMLSNAHAELETVQGKMQKLQEQASKLADANSELAQNVAKIAKPFNSSEIIEAVMVNNFTAPLAGNAQRVPMISIENITLNKGNKEPSGIYRGTINMTIKAISPEIIMSYLDHITSKTNYYFALNAINLPIDTAGTATNNEVSVSVTLGVYYYP